MHARPEHPDRQRLRADPPRPCRGEPSGRAQGKGHPGNRRGTREVLPGALRPRSAARLTHWPARASRGPAHIDPDHAPLHAAPLPYKADPAHWFERIRHAPGAVLLDSGWPVAERGRFDILSAWPSAIFEPAQSESGRDFSSVCARHCATWGRPRCPTVASCPSRAD